MSNKEQQAWKASLEVKDVAERLIKTTPEHQHLVFCPILYLFNRNPEKVRGAEALATASKLTGRPAFLLLGGHESASWTEPEPTFVISVYEDAWNRLTDAQKEALVDHELCHCKLVDEEDATRMTIKPHDIEEFSSVVRRHGAWRPDIASFIRDCKSGQETIDYGSASNG